ncbi:Threonylcarbamoyl-AMP synthase [hydrothermal vent metagenome]|uniref:L-threonylcarbamoyladenylate synthase n=1 Tax=hydrothermal vent metagenome TaxID=652676 RepID=A0A3B0ZKN9_9ZZZZ
MHSFQLKHASRLIRQGAVVACPTEAVYGLSCHPLLPEAVTKILTLKQRSIDKGLILIASEVSQLVPYVADPTVFSQKNISASWPGATSWLVPANPDTPHYLTGRYSTIAVRVTDHPTMAELCQQCGHALVSTSANISGRLPATNALKIRKIFGSSLDWILHAETGHNTQVSQIYDMSGTLVRG